MPASEPHIENLDEQTTAVIRARVPMAELAPFFDRSYGAIVATITVQGVAITGPAFARYESQPTDVADLEVGFPVAEPIVADGGVVPSTLPGGPAATLVHEGSFDTLGESWGQLFAWATDSFFEATGPFWEVYVTEPSPEMDPADLRTALYLPGLPSES